MAESDAAPFLATDDEEIERCFHAGPGWARCGGGRPTGHGCCCCTDSGCAARGSGRGSRSAAGRPRAGGCPVDEAVGRTGPPRAASGRREQRHYRPKAWALLSPQELQVAQLAGQGLSNREIAERLFLSHRTVGSHRYRIFPKLGVTHRPSSRPSWRHPATPVRRRTPDRPCTSRVTARRACGRSDEIDLAGPEVVARCVRVSGAGAAAEEIYEGRTTTTVLPGERCRLVALSKAARPSASW